MASRKQLWHPDEARQKIQASQLINRLTDNALSDEEIMSAGQVRSAEILLRKAIPDLASVQLGGDPENPVRIGLAEGTGRDLARRIALALSQGE